MKKIILSLIILTVSALCFAERKIDFLTGFSPMVIINTDDAKKSAPSPVVYPITFGLVFPKESHISFQPQLSFFTNYYLYSEDEKAAPAEIENRTATVFSFLIDFPVEFEFNPAEKHSITAGGAASVLARFGVLSSGVKGSDTGTTGTASDDVDEINRWFWQNGRFFYLQGNINYMYKFSDSIKAGPELKFYLPCGSLFSGDGLNSTMISLGLKARF